MRLRVPICAFEIGSPQDGHTRFRPLSNCDDIRGVASFFLVDPVRPEQQHVHAHTEAAELDQEVLAQAPQRNDALPLLLPLAVAPPCPWRIPARYRASMNHALERGSVCRRAVMARQKKQDANSPSSEMYLDAFSSFTCLRWRGR